ncbi:MAG: hypothetical protein AAB568_04210 [Patescibacteria group bacterium]
MKHRKRRDRPHPEKREAVSATPMAPVKTAVPGWEVGQMETTLVRSGSIICVIDSDGEGAEMLLSPTTNVIVQRRSTGQMDIMFGPGVFDHHQRRDVLKTLRIRERERIQKKVAHRYNWKELSTIGILDGWHYNDTREIISNRNPVTQLTVDEVVGIIKLALSPRFDLERSKWCQQGVCHNREWDQCPLYRFGFARCVAVRQAMEVSVRLPALPEAEEAVEGIFLKSE